tara:strand:- start:3683 stop:4093 length:411 start_codon:yes stop_codon:yes gene_type:complete
MIDYKAQGRRNRAAGARFELKTRKDLESKGWTVVKHQNNIDLENSCFYPAKQKFIRGRGMGLGSGFPDFIAFCHIIGRGYKLKFVECKVNGKLSKEEKLKMEWLENEGFECEVASKNGTLVEYQRPHRVRRKTTGD